MTSLKLASISALLAIATSTTPAAADSIDEPADGSEERDPTRAFAISLGATLASGAFVWGAVAAYDNDHHDAAIGLAVTGATGLLIGPSLGHVYGRDKYLTLGGGMRLASIGLAGLALANFSWGDACPYGCDHDYNSPRKDDGNETLFALGVIGAPLLFLGGTIYDIATAARDTKDANAARLKARPMPAVMRGVTGPVAGLGIGGEF